MHIVIVTAITTSNPADSSLTVGSNYICVVCRGRREGDWSDFVYLVYFV
jgi:hypothetical protein